MPNNIVQRIVLEGADVIRTALAEIGKTGKTAFDTIQAAAARVTPVLTSVEGAAKVLSTSFQNVQVKATLAATSMTAAATAAKGFNAAITANVANIVSPFQALGAGVQQLAGHFKVTSAEASHFGHAIAGLGRSLQLPEISHLGHLVGTLGRAFQIAAVPLLGIVLERLASSAAKAADAVQDAGFKLNATTKEMGQLSLFATGVGLQFDKFVKSSESLKKVMEETVKAEEELSKARAERAQQADRVNGVEEHFQQTTAKTLTILQKLGVSIQPDAFGQVHVTIEAYEKIADALQRVGQADRRAALENELVAAGIDKALLPALRNGAEAVRAYIREAERIKPPFTDDDNKRAERFLAAEQGVADAAASVRNAMGLALSPAFVAFFDRIRDALVDARPSLEHFASTMGTVLAPALKAVASGIALLIDIFKGLAAVMQGILNFFGLNTTKAQAFLVVATALIVVFGGWPVAILALIASFGALWDAIKKGFDGFKQAASDVISQVVGFFQDWYNKVLGWINDLIEKFKALIGLGAASSSEAAASGGESFASGGYVRGAGSGTSDSILARVSNGEYVMRSAAVSHYGTNFMHAVNNLRAFAMGGLVSIPRFASGGAVSSGPSLHPVTIDLGGGLQIGGLFAAPDAVSELSRVAVARRISRAGRKPGFYS